MTPGARPRSPESLVAGAAAARTLTDLAALLRALRRRHARDRRDRILTYRELADRTGWSQTAIAEYFTAKTLPPTDRFDALAGLLGATPDELGALGNARDRVEDHRYDARPAPAPAAVVPRQLPAAPRNFVGRAAELAALTAWSQRRLPVGAVVVSAVGGTAGVGKTALVVHWAHQVADGFPDGQIFLNLRGFDPGGRAMEPAEAVRDLLDALHVAQERIPDSFAAQTALYRSLVATRRMLIILDNARDTAQVRPLLPGAPGCLVVVTSRNHLSGLVATDGAEPLGLDLLTLQDARDLLSGRLGAARTAAEPDAVEEIVARCARLPLALAVVAARAAIHPQFSLHDLAAELRDARDRLDVLATDEAGSMVRTVFSWSYHALTPSAAAMFRLLGVHPHPALSLGAAASLAGRPAAEVRSTLAELTRANLVAEPAAGRYTCHDLLHAYAAELARTADGPHVRRSARARMFAYYLHTAHAADRLLLPHREPPLVPDPAPAGVRPDPLADRDRAMDWLTTEHRVLLAVTAEAADTGFDPQAGQLAWTLCTFFQWRGHWQDQVATQHIALRTARRRDDEAGWTGRAHAHHHLARAYTKLGRAADALGHFRHALRLFDRCGDPDGQAQTHLGLGAVFEQRGRHRAALRHARRGLELFRLAGNRPGQANAMNSAGWCHAQLGDHERAVAACREALRLQQEIGDRDGEAATWDSLGYAHHRLGGFTEAADCYQRAVDLRRELGDRFYEAATLERLGATRLAAGDPAAAALAWRAALAILDALGHADADRVRHQLQGVGPS